MTYNFDPDNWYEDKLSMIRTRFEAGKMTQEEYDLAVSELELKLEDMWKRLNGTYQVVSDESPGRCKSQTDMKHSEC